MPEARSGPSVGGPAHARAEARAGRGGSAGTSAATSSFACPNVSTSTQSSAPQITAHSVIVRMSTSRCAFRWSRRGSVSVAKCSLMLVRGSSDILALRPRLPGRRAQYPRQQPRLTKYASPTLNRSSNVMQSPCSVTCSARISATVPRQTSRTPSALVVGRPSPAIRPLAGHHAGCDRHDPTRFPRPARPVTLPLRPCLVGLRRSLVSYGRISAPGR